MPPFENTSYTGDLIGLFGQVLDDGNDSFNSPTAAVPLVGVRVEAEAVDFVAEVKLTQCYHNTEAKPLEAVYHFPVDEAAAVCGFEAEYEDGTVVKGVVKEKNEAKRDYEQAKSAGQQANLLQTVRRDLLTINVGNLPAGGFLKITITYVTTLQARDDAAAFILPTCIAPRYTPQDEALSSSETEAMVAQASSIKWYGLAIKACFSCRSNIQSITSPTHALDGTMSCHVDSKTGYISFQNVTMDRDLVVLVKEEDCHQPRASVERSEDGTMTGFVTIFPRLEFPDQKRDFTFIVDRSGSMEGENIEQARDALLLFLRALPTSCTFNIVGFGSHFQSLFDSPQPYNDNTLASASEYARSMDADFGGTEILSPLKYVFGQKPPVGTECQVFVLTDGEVSNDLQVFDLIRQFCSKKRNPIWGLLGSSRTQHRLFSVGVGRHVSRHLVAGMARTGRGTFRFVEEGSADSLRVKVLGQLKQAQQPSMNDVAIEWTFPETETVVEDQRADSESESEPPPPVKTLLGYRSPAVDKTASIVNQAKPALYPSTIPPIFSKEKFVSFAMFPCGSKVPESVRVTCDTIDGPLEVNLKVSDDEIFHGSIARRLAARMAISEYENSRTSRYTPYGNIHSPSGDAVLGPKEALRLALDNSLGSELTCFIAIKTDPVLERGSACVTTLIPQTSFPPAQALPRQVDRPKATTTCMNMQSNISQMLNNTAMAESLSNESNGLAAQVSIFQKKAASRPSRNMFLPASGWAMLWKRRGTTSEKNYHRHTLCRPELKYGAAGDGETQNGPRGEKGVCTSTDTDACHPSTPSDKLMVICMLQKANGSFLLNEQLLAAISLTKTKADEMSSMVGSPDPFVWATILAVSAWRLHFSKQRNVWGLQEEKALAFLDTHMAEEKAIGLIRTNSAT